jgi:hypothetical protein
MRIILRGLAAAVAAGALALLAPASAFAHQLNERYQAPLPLVAYVIGAALAVGMSFAFVTLRNAPPPQPALERQPKKVPAWLRTLLAALGLIGWLWIVVQTMVGGSGAGDVASLFMWVYGWVGVALVSALVGPAWEWLNPFATLHRILGSIGERIGLSGGEYADYPARFGRWPAAVGFAAVVWIELVARIDGGRTLGLLLIAYTFITVAGMSYFGREQWRHNAEIFTVWFRLLGRLAPYELVGDPEAGQVRRRPFGSGLTGVAWTTSELVIVTLATGAIILDGLSQTQIYFDLFARVDLFGLPVLRETLIAVAFLGGLTAVVLIMARRLNTAALGAGLLPVAVGYLIAHYLTYLLVDGQRILAAINDPLLRGDNLLPGGFAFYEPSLFLPAAVVWSIQLAAVIGGHIVGAWAGHAALADEARTAPEAAGARGARRVAAVRQIPLAALMVSLTSITLWSLGQAALSPAAAQSQIETTAPGPDQRAVSSAASTERTSASGRSPSWNIAQPAEMDAITGSPRAFETFSSRT